MLTFWVLTVPCGVVQFHVVPGGPLNKSGSPSHTCVAPVMMGGGGGASTVNCTRSVACPQLFVTVTSTSCVPAVLKQMVPGTAVFAEPGVPFWKSQL